RVAVVIFDPHNTRRYFQIRGRVVNCTADGAAEHVEKLSQKYTGTPYSWYGGRQQQRVILTIAPEHVSSMGR
ncbi:MAG: PPOX class F420-dependent oxidoreductase, partial [Negativicutes bacterium]|nr:PPOX class F420-dependent oxidoreductase [Negativicutes bacterium]